MVVVQADAGYGKTAFARRVAQLRPTAWYSLTSGDRDLFVLLTHLAAALDTVAPGLLSRLAAQWQAPGGVAARWPALVDALADAADELLTGDAVCVLDDYHLIDGTSAADALARFIDRLPAHLHLLITSQVRPTLPGLSRWHAHGWVTTVDRRELIFRPDEVRDYYQYRHRLPLADEQAALLAEYTEGWPIAMHLAARVLHESCNDSSVPLAQRLHELPAGWEEIHSYLREHVLDRHSRATRNFLLATAVVDRFDRDLCAALLDTDAGAQLDQVAQWGLYCVADGSGGYRYQHWFREFLLRQADPDATVEYHRRAGAHFRQRGEAQAAARHALAAGAHDDAAADLATLGDGLIYTGRYQTLLELSDRLPPGARSRHPRLLVARSDALRYTSRYHTALTEAQRAAEAAAGIGDLFDAHVAEALVHLDTVAPSAANAPLRAAGRLLPHVDEDRRRRWHALAVENQINEGRLDRAAFHRSRLAGHLPGHASIRLAVRRGDLDDTLTLLDREPQPPAERVPRSHREDDALRAWVYALMGQAEQAQVHARLGITAGRDLASPIVECVCLGRLGHAQLCGPQADTDTAIGSFTEALHIAERIEVARFRAESLIGLCFAHGRAGDFAPVWRHGCEALEILQHAGDRYLTAFARLAIGAGAELVAHPDAASWLKQAVREAAACGDRYITTTARLWLARHHLRRGDRAAFAGAATAALTTMREHGMQFLLLAAPWTGIPSTADRLTIARAAAALPEVGEYAGYLAAQLDGVRPEPVAPPPATAGLSIRTLGRFAVLRDGRDLDAAGWGRRKARELLWLLCSRDSRSIAREEAVELLWPGQNLEPGAVRFRVALHALQEALEPDRPARAATRFVHATGERIVLDDAVRVDADEFRRLAGQLRREADPAHAAALADQALHLYQGPFLTDAPYADWAAPTRGELAGIFADLVLRAATLHAGVGQAAQAIPLLRRLLTDDPYHEQAWRLLAAAYLAEGRPAAAREAYQECAGRLWDDLRVRPGWQLHDLAAHTPAGRST
ncbi:tetratricopeptide repeat protein [Micromonospora sp. NBC_00898]|uniref:BTAD domain-containing putative transcriptional regulator n=1 Tax=Micromonospora sp. NBC_00898 TaxID=2975981 RepID=UPI003867F27F|nr:tetratricopeptide repeat protein [Micromonospora sp. NBC_00898]